MNTKLNRTQLEEIAKPEGWKLVPEQMYLNADAIECICSQCGDGGKIYGNFTAGILWIGEVLTDDCNGIKYGLNISSAEYPEKGTINIYEFDNPLRSHSAVTRENTGMKYYHYFIYTFRLTRLLLKREIPLRIFIFALRAKPGAVAGKHGSFIVDPFYDDQV